jgi:hypothetical protein
LGTDIKLSSKFFRAPVQISEGRKQIGHVPADKNTQTFA